nr:uncharacterized protein LOC124814333 [Hydra vulgaris]
MNPNLSPKFCMTDYCNEEIDALEETFPDCKVLVCDFHREQAWERWLVKVSNGCANHKSNILLKLRKIAHSTTINAMELAVMDLKQSDFWNNENFLKLRKYIETYWLPIKERWVWAYCQNRLLVNLNTNNGVERQNKSFKYFYLQRFKNYSLTGMLTILIEEFFIDKYQSYTEKNFKMDSRYRRYAKIIPNFLINRPRALVKHCLQKISLAGSIDLSKVTMINHGVFSIKNNKENYQINFGNDRSMPNCTCPSWRSSCFPCKHFFAIFRKFPLWQWDALSELYLNSPFLTLDHEENTLPDKINCFQNKETLYATNECDISLPNSKNLDLSEEINAKKNV